MKKIIISAMLFINSLEAVEHSREHIQLKYNEMKYILDNADLYAMDLRLMCWLNGYCAGLKYVLDGEVIMKDGPK